MGRALRVGLSTVDDFLSMNMIFKANMPTGESKFDTYVPALGIKL